MPGLLKLLNILSENYSANNLSDSCGIMKIKFSAFILFFLIFSELFPQGVGKGKRFDLTDELNLDRNAGQFAQLFIPDYFLSSEEGKYVLVCHFHSASWAAENEVYKSHANVVLFNIHLGAFSSPYKNYFSDSRKFEQILTLVNAKLSSEGILQTPSIKNLVITSFSAGYAGVREILKSQSYYEIIDAITLADGLHANLEPSIMKEQMKNFLRFAKDARDGKKIMLLTHSSILTYTYANTTETANYLIENIGARSVPVHIEDPIGTMYTRCDTGKFHVCGYYGDTAQDHLKHLYNMDMMLKRVMEYLTSAAQAETRERKKLGFELEQNYPNPFSSVTTIEYNINGELHAMDFPFNKVVLEVFNVLGEKVATVVNSLQYSGKHRVRFDGTNLPSGIYFCSLKYGNRMVSRKMILRK